MGDRGNIVLRSKRDHKQIVLYTHWTGSDLPSILAKALDSRPGRNRWDDEPYLNRIIFCEMLKGNVDEETGYGIGVSEAGDADTVIYLNHSEQTIVFNGKMYSYEDFILMQKLGHPVV